MIQTSVVSARQWVIAHCREHIFVSVITQFFHAHCIHSSLWNMPDEDIKSMQWIPNRKTDILVHAQMLKKWLRTCNLVPKFCIFASENNDYECESPHLLNSLFTPSRLPRFVGESRSAQRDALLAKNPRGGRKLNYNLTELQMNNKSTTHTCLRRLRLHVKNYDNGL